jgi:hypothetical protein
MPQTPKKHYKFPRRFSRSYCLKKPCNKMGFTEKASCRPYKNCYKNKMGGSSKKPRSTRSRSSTRKSSKAKAKPAPTFMYHSEETSFSSHPGKGSPHGKRTVVNITDNTGKRRSEVLNSSGKTLKVNSKKLNKQEIMAMTRMDPGPGLLFSLL